MLRPPLEMKVPPSGNEACNDWNAAWEGGPATDADLSRPQSWNGTRSLGQPR